MPDAVACAECGNTYDSESTPFCPRCGSDKGKGLAGAVPMSRRDLPVRRRVQMGGVILLVLGLLLGGTGGFIAAAPDLALDNMAANLAAAEGGTVSLNVTEDGQGVQASYRMVSIAGDRLGNGTTDANGTWTGDAPAALFHLLVDIGNDTWNRTVVSLDGQETAVSIDTADPRTDDDWVGFEGRKQATRVAGGVLLALAAMMIAGGIAAVRVVARGLMAAGGVAALLPAVILVAASPTGGVLLLIPALAAFLLVLQARRL